MNPVYFGVLMPLPLKVLQKKEEKMMILQPMGYKTNELIDCMDR